MESPPKRLKMPPLPAHHAADLLLHPQKKLPTPSKLPVRHGSTIRTAPPTISKGSLYASPRLKGSQGLSRRSPYGERPAQVKPEGVKLNFGTLREGGGRFRRAGGLRLSQSPARRSSFFNDSNTSSGVQRMGILGVESDSPPESTGDSGSSPEQPQVQGPRKTEALKAVSKSTSPPTRRQVPRTVEVIEPIDTKSEVLRKLLEARVNALRIEVENLKEEINQEESRVERETRAVPKPGENDMEALMKRLLSANDSSHASLPALRPTSPEIPSAKPLSPSDPLLQLSIFHCLTFTSTTTNTITSSPAELALADHVSTTQRNSASGFAANRLLFFNVVFDVSVPSWHVGRTTYAISSWARRELQHPLDRAAAECDINTILYAISSYTTLARTRASVFAALGRAFPDLLPVLAPRGGRRELVPWLGTALLRFRDRSANGGGGGGGGGGVELVVSWSITVGVGGETESCVAADVRLPVNWTDADEMRSLAKFGDVFRALVKERGVFEATKCVVGLVFQ